MALFRPQDSHQTASFLNASNSRRPTRAVVIWINAASPSSHHLIVTAFTCKKAAYLRPRRPGLYDIKTVILPVIMSSSSAAPAPKQQTTASSQASPSENTPITPITTHQKSAKQLSKSKSAHPSPFPHPGPPSNQPSPTSRPPSPDTQEAAASINVDHDHDSLDDNPVPSSFIDSITPRQAHIYHLKRTSSASLLDHVFVGPREQTLRRNAMSAYSSSSQDSVYSTPGPQQYSLVTPGFAQNPRSMTQVSPGLIFVNLLYRACPLPTLVTLFLLCHFFSSTF